MFQEYSDGESLVPPGQVQAESVVGLSGPVAYGSQTSLMKAHNELFVSDQHCRDLEMSLFLKEMALEQRDISLMHTREQLQRAYPRPSLSNRQTCPSFEIIYGTPLHLLIFSADMISLLCRGFVAYQLILCRLPEQLQLSFDKEHGCGYTMCACLQALATSS